MTISCPKCHADMRMYERNGIHIDQCTECRGIFLDRGELEHLISAESSWAGQQRAATPPPATQQGGQGYGKPYKKRKSFLEELFD